MKLAYDNASFFSYVVKFPDRPDQTGRFDAVAVANKVTPVGGQQFDSGVISIPVMGSNLDMTLTLLDDSPFNSSWASAEWFLAYSPIAKQRM